MLSMACRFWKIKETQGSCFPDGSLVKNPPASAGDKETWVQSLGQEDPLDKGMATHSNILAWSIPWTEEPGGLWFIGLQRVQHN